METMTTTTLGEALRRQRETLGFSQRQAADAIGVSQAAFQKWELGTTKPGIDRIEAVADFLDGDYETVFELWKDAGLAQMTNRQPTPVGNRDRIDALERLVHAQAAELDQLRDRLNSVTGQLRDADGAD